MALRTKMQEVEDRDDSEEKTIQIAQYSTVSDHITIKHGDSELIMLRVNWESLKDLVDSILY